MYKLTYFKDDSMDPIDLTFTSYRKLINYIDGETFGRNNIVYLLTMSDCAFQNIFISESSLQIQSLIEYKSVGGFHGVQGHYHLHEYPSYESAYAVALDMKEANPLCYDPAPYINEDGDLIEE